MGAHVRGAAEELLTGGWWGGDGGTVVPSHPASLWICSFPNDNQESCVKPFAFIFFLEDAFQAQPESCWQKGELPTLSSPSSSGSSPRDFKILPGTAKIFLNFCPVPAAVHWISSHPYTGIQGRGSFRSIIC